MIRNWYLLSGVIIISISVLPLLFFLIPHQLREIEQRSNNKRVKKYVLGLEVFIALTMLPGLPAVIGGISRPAKDNWVRLANISNRLPFLGIMVLLMLIWFYKLKPEDLDE